AERTADPRLRGVADAVEVEQQAGPAAAGLEGRHSAPEPVAAQPRQVDTELTFDRDLTGSSKRAHAGPAPAGKLEHSVLAVGIDVSHWYPSGCFRSRSSLRGLGLRNRLRF